MRDLGRMLEEIHQIDESALTRNRSGRNEKTIQKEGWVKYTTSRNLQSRIISILFKLAEKTGFQFLSANGLWYGH